MMSDLFISDKININIRFLCITHFKLLKLNGIFRLHIYIRIKHCELLAILFSQIGMVKLSKYESTYSLVKLLLICDFQFCCELFYGF